MHKLLKVNYADQNLSAKTIPTNVRGIAADEILANFIVLYKERRRHKGVPNGVT